MARKKNNYKLGKIIGRKYSIKEIKEKNDYRNRN
jgi:hypothetical protein